MTINKHHPAIRGIIIVALVGATVYGVYHFTMLGSAYYARYIAKMTGASYVKLMTFDPAYLKAWFGAIKKGDSTFTLNGSVYDKVTGTKIAPSL